MYEKFEETLGDLQRQPSRSKENVSVITYKFDEEFKNGKLRPLSKVRTIHYSLNDIKDAFSNYSDVDASEKLDQTLTNILGT